MRPGRLRAPARAAAPPPAGPRRPSASGPPSHPAPPPREAPTPTRPLLAASPAPHPPAAARLRPGPRQRDAAPRRRPGGLAGAPPERRRPRPGAPQPSLRSSRRDAAPQAPLTPTNRALSPAALTRSPANAGRARTRRSQGPPPALRAAWSRFLSALIPRRDIRARIPTPGLFLEPGPGQTELVQSARVCTAPTARCVPPPGSPLPAFPCSLFSVSPSGSLSGLSYPPGGAQST